MKNKKKRLYSQGFAIAMKQVKMEASWPSQAVEYERKVTKLKLERLGLSLDSVVYKQAYTNAVKVFEKIETGKEKEIMKRKGPLAYFALMKSKIFRQAVNA